VLSPVSHIKIGFIQGQRFEDLGVLGEDLLGLLRDLFINLETRLRKDQIGTCRFAVTDGIADRMPNFRAS
jgi:hypothetical protein